MELLQQRHRTKNYVEGWNDQINYVLGRPYPRIKDLIKGLKQEAEKSDKEIMRMKLYIEGLKRRKKYS